MMTTSKATVTTNIAISIAAFARDWRNGNLAPLNAEVLKYFGVKELSKIEDAIRHASDPAKAAYDCVIALQHA